jgi:hypothetical protein
MLLLINDGLWFSGGSAGAGSCGVFIVVIGRFATATITVQYCKMVDLNGLSRIESREYMEQLRGGQTSLVAFVLFFV